MLGYVQPYNIMVRRTHHDREYGLLRVKRGLAPEFIWGDSIIRGALVVASDSTEDEGLVVDTIDYDMFLRVKKEWPHYTDNE